jgi:hypothetical protein
MKKGDTVKIIGYELNQNEIKVGNEITIILNEDEFHYYDNLHLIENKTMLSEKYNHYWKEVEEVEIRRKDLPF